MAVTGLNPERAERGRGDLEHGRQLGLWQVSGNEEPGLAERLCQREPPGHRQMADLTGGHEALHRQVLAKTFARFGREARKVLLDEHARLATGLPWEQGNRADEIIGVRDGHRVLTAAADTRLEDRRVYHRRREGFNRCGLTVGRDLPAKR